MSLLAVQVLQRRGCDVAFVGGSSSVIAAAGLGGRGVHVGIWDTLAPPQSACIGTLPFHQVRVAAGLPVFSFLWRPGCALGPPPAGPEVQHILGIAFGVKSNEG